jgi:hypothetical protein
MIPPFDVTYGTNTKLALVILLLTAMVFAANSKQVNISVFLGSFKSCTQD